MVMEKWKQGSIRMAPGILMWMVPGHGMPETGQVISELQAGRHLLENGLEN
jgi:hypothetical protein